MRASTGAIAAALLLVATLVCIATLTRASGALAAARMSGVTGAAIFYSAGFLIFSGTWTYLLWRVPGGPGSGCARQARPARAFRVGLMALAGLLTPMNLGTDVLRSVLGRRYLDLDLPATAAASIVTREFKLRATVAVLPMALAFTVFETTAARGPLLLALGGLLAIALALAAFRSDAASGLARSLGIGRLADATRDLHRRVGWKPRGILYLAFGLGLASEWQALRCCFESLGVPPDPRVTLGAFGAIYLLSRTPIVPLGVGVAEVGGLAWLRLAHVPEEQAGALVVIWGSLRILLPHALAAASAVAGLLEARS